MKPYLCALAIALAVCVCGSAGAQETPQFPAPEKEHEWLQQFEGEWITQAKASMGPDLPPIECQGTMSSRMIGGRWIINEMQGDAAGTPMTAIQTIGYDPQRKKYVGTWIDSMTNHLWHYVGTVDANGKTLTLEADGPNMMAEGKTTKFRDSYEFQTPDTIITTSSMLAEDGEWVTFMTGKSTRNK